MANYTDQNNYVIALQQEQAAYDQAMYELLERSADRACMAVETLAEAINRLAVAITDQANVRITDT